MVPCLLKKDLYYLCPLWHKYISLYFLKTNHHVKKKGVKIKGEKGVRIKLFQLISGDMSLNLEQMGYFFK